MLQIKILKLGFFALLSCFFTYLTHANELPHRTSLIPETTNSVPHVQIDLTAVPEISDALLKQVDAIDGVNIQRSVLSLPGALGFWINEGIKLKRPHVLVRGREFSHLHPDGSLHAFLPEKLAIEAVSKGWATPHPWAGQRAGWEGFVMIYTPLSQEDLEIVLQLVTASYAYIAGES